MRHSLVKRVERLEKQARLQTRVVPPESNREERLFQEKADELLSRIDEKYARLIREGCSADPAEWSHLAVTFFKRVLDHVHEDRPLAFPTGVAEAYLRDPCAGAAVSCKSCRYKLPAGHFTECPVCGGFVAELAWSVRSADTSSASASPTHT
ncbi:MAG: hypothetical protein C5B51_17950 [Terriglobia bacterium]|nr:MAG: hypothetical protein C5B51_17950 [Terriglobia bacterium]